MQHLASRHRSVTSRTVSRRAACICVKPRRVSSRVPWVAQSNVGCLALPAGIRPNAQILILRFLRVTAGQRSRHR